jgi:hypothetical protein
MVIIGGGVVKIFIDRAFRGIDEGIKELNDDAKLVAKDLEEIWDFYNALHEEIIRLQLGSAPAAKLSDLKAEFLEKFQSIGSAESNFNLLLASINSLTSKFEKLEEKTLRYITKHRTENDE